jgi:hypothetical protein
MCGTVRGWRFRVRVDRNRPKRADRAVGSTSINAAALPSAALTYARCLSPDHATVGW